MHVCNKVYYRKLLDLANWCAAQEVPPMASVILFEGPGLESSSAAATHADETDEEFEYAFSDGTRQVRGSYIALDGPFTHLGRLSINCGDMSYVKCTQVLDFRQHAPD